MTEYVTIPKLEGAAEVRVALSEYRHKQRVDIREYFASGGAMHPTRRGVNLPVQDLPALLAGLQALERDALRHGLLEMEDYENAGLPVPPALLDAA